MLSLSQNVIDAGAFVACYGATDLFKDGPGVVLTDLIKAFTAGGPSHAALLEPGGKTVLQSTILNGVSGPQRTPLEPWIETEYLSCGGRVIAYPFLASMLPNWTALEVCADAMIAMQEAGALKYGWEQLFTCAECKAPELAAILPFAILAALGQHGAGHGIFCSAAVAVWLRAGWVRAKAIAVGIPWLPKSDPPGNDLLASPQDLVQMPIWLRAEPLVLA